MTNKLYYFDARGLCEPIRWILKIGGMEFEEFRNSMEGNRPGDPSGSPLRPDVKKKTNWGQVPVMEFEGRKLCQSNAIARYFAKRYGLTGSNEWESALCDEYVDSARELLYGFVPLFIETDVGKLEVLKKEVVEKMEERFLNKFNEIVEKNDGRHLVGQKLTWADLWLVYVIEDIEMVGGINLASDKYPGIQALMRTVYAVPQVKEWIAIRPKTTY